MTRRSRRARYAASKLLGEWFALDAPTAYVLRVESLFGAPRWMGGRTGTMDAIVAGIEAGRDVRVFTDRVVSPSLHAGHCRGDTPSAPEPRRSRGCITA